jgi:hypothetical protein
MIEGAQGQFGRERGRKVSAVKTLGAGCPGDAIRCR